jgi:hypothetical protein
MVGLWPSSNYYPGIRPERPRRTTKNLPHQSMSLQIPTRNLLNMSQALQFQPTCSLIFPHIVPPILWRHSFNYNISTVIYNTISQHCIPHSNQIYLQSRRDWTIVKYAHQSALADTWMTRRDYTARTGWENHSANTFATPPQKGTIHNLRNDPAFQEICSHALHSRGHYPL